MSRTQKPRARDRILMALRRLVCVFRHDIDATTYEQWNSTGDNFRCLRCDARFKRFADLRRRDRI